MLIGELPGDEVGRRLRTSGIPVDSGAMITRVKIDSRHMREVFSGLYTNYLLCNESRVEDVEVRFVFSPRFSRFFRPRIQPQINGHPTLEPLPQRFAGLLLESTLNWCVVLKETRHLILHSAVVERDGCALLLPAPSGSGKSSLCAALTARGWRLLSDELTIVRTDNGLVMPNPRPISLKNEAIEAIRSFAPELYLSDPIEGTMKGTIAYVRPSAEDVRKANVYARPMLVITPSYHAGASTHLKDLDKAESFMWLAKSAVNYFSLQELGFETLANLVDRCTVSKLIYSNLDEAIQLLDRLHRDRSESVKVA